MSGARTATLLGAAFGLLLLAGQATAGEVSGTAEVVGGTVESDDAETDVTQQDYRVSFYQPLTPWLTINLGYRYGKDRTSSDIVAERARSVPEFSLLYSRPRLIARLNLFEQKNSGTAPSSNFDIRSGSAYVSWRPTRGPSYVLQYRDESNVADVALFGRDTDSTLLQLDTIYDGDDWGVRFSHQDSEIDNKASGFQLDQVRNQVRADYLRRWRDGAYTLAAETWLSRVDQTQAAPSGSLLAQPVNAVDGLFAVDLSPGFGELNSTPELVDGNTDLAVGSVAIGGAEIGRNIGVDLGATQPVSRLEITVNAISDPALLWEVYHSPDNFNWTLVAGVSSSYDDAFDRYTLQFPETTDRYFKAVNVSANALTGVSVTEIRALVDVDILGRAATESSTYRLDVLSTLRPHELVRGNVRMFFSNEDDIDLNRVSQDVDQLSVGTDWTIDLGHHLEAGFNVHYDEFEKTAPAVRREVQRRGADLTWRPLETVRGTFQVSKRKETDGGTGIRNSEDVRVRLLTGFYQTLSLTSEISKGTVEDGASGFSQTVIRWIETLESEPTTKWRIGGSSTISWFDSVGIQTVTRRIGLDMFTTWRIFPFVTFTGLLGYSEDDFTENLQQRYTLSWSPGRKLSASIYFQDADAVDTRRVTSAGASVSYRINRRLLFFGNLSTSETEQFGMEPIEVTNARLGLRATF